MMTDAEFQAWLDDDSAERVALYDIDVYDTALGAEVTRCISSKPYSGGDPANPYQCVLAQGLRIVEAITRDSKPRISASEIRVWNVNGERDSWFDDVWKNGEIRVWIGDVNWPKSEFRLFVVWVVDDIDPTGATDEDGRKFSIKMRDALERLNTPVSELLLPDGSVWPHTFGESLNITPKLKNAGTNEFTYHPTATEGLIEARVEGKPRTSVTENRAAGAFTLTTAIGPGAVTASVQGDKTGGIYRNTIGALVRLLVTAYGDASKRFTEAELDGENFDAFEAAHPYAVGLYLTERTLVAEACAQLASTVRAQLIPTLLGKLRLIKFAVPAVATTSIRPWQYEGGVIPVARFPAVAAVKIGFCENYTVQPNLQTSIPAEHKALFAAQWRTTTPAVDPVVRDRHKQTGEPVQTNGRLLNEEDAATVQESQLAQDKVARMTFAVDGTASLLLQQLGEGATLYADGYGLETGKLGQITLRGIDLDTFRVDTQVTV